MSRQKKVPALWSIALLLSLGLVGKPAVAQTTEPAATGTQIDDDDGFDDWGLLGLLGLAGLMGRRRDPRDTVEPRRM